jgi:tungstate transport system ATP-binding protein
MAASIIALRDIIVRYGDVSALTVSSLEARDGEVIALVGPNGAGKSTLLRVMGLLQQPTAGKLYFRGEEVCHANTLRLRRCIASVFQEPLLVNASVYENAALGLKLRRLPNGQVNKRLRPWLERFALGGLAARPAHTLSGGEARRTSLVRAFALEPELLLLDEPFSALDQPSRDSLFDDLQVILKETGITTVFATHDPNEAFTLADRVAVFNRGCMAHVGSTAEVFFRPRTEEVAQIVGIVNRLPSVVEASAGEFVIIRCNRERLQIPGKFAIGSHVTLCIRAEDIFLTRGNSCEAASEFQPLKARVVRMWPGLLHNRVTLECGTVRLVALVKPGECRDLKIAIGSELTACFAYAAAHVIGPGDDLAS